MVQILLTWHTDLTYWGTQVSLERVEQLNFGFGIVDYSVHKAIIACHTIKERDDIADFLSECFEIKLTALILTKPLLDQIGSFDSVKRAQYAVNNPDAITPSNITYADDNLASRRVARDEENNSRSQRVQSFYRIPLIDRLVEEGVGATSQSGKLWIPQETPIESVRDYGTALLAKISGTFDKMVKKDEIEDVLSTFPFDNMPRASVS